VQDLLDQGVAAVLRAVQAYACVSVVIAVLIAGFGVQRLDASALGWRNLGFRVIITPGLCVLWPWLIKRVVLGAPPPMERNAHRMAAGS
jgi:hydrogenase-4 membrane subunit HyfE